MSPEPKNQTPRAADHLANERTFLAWIRTRIALMGFGFVIVKLTLFIRQLSVAPDTQISPNSKGYSSINGVSMMAAGAIRAVLAYFRYLKVERQLNTGSYKPSKWLRP